jgi:hypothetical protein
MNAYAFVHENKLHLIFAGSMNEAEQLAAEQTGVTVTDLKSAVRVYTRQPRRVVTVELVEAEAEDSETD